MLRISQVSASAATAGLLIFGLAGLLASLLFNLLYRLMPIKFLATAMTILTASLISLHYLSHSEIALFILILIWGIGISALGLGMQMRVLQLAPDATDLASSIYSSIYNIGIGGGALIGNQVMQHLGLKHIGDVGAILGIIAILWFIFIQLKFRHRPLHIQH
ncbi:hypothetical protein [Gallibacterium salpingitidis]|nr:hypothetical protein [Gallibacterium salpingitidis]